MKAHGLLAGVAAILLTTTGCELKGPSVAADPAFASEANSLQRPPEDKARVYIISGTSDYLRHGVAADIFVNGEKIGVVNASEAMVFDVIPGRYSMFWMVHNRPNRFLAKSPRFERVLNGGQVLVLSADVDGSDLILRLVASATHVERGQLNPALKLTITRPSSCPTTICP